MARLVLIICLLAPTVANGRQADWTRIEHLVAEAPLLSFELHSEEWLGDRHQASTGRVVRLGPDSLRMDVEDGAGAGGTVVLRGRQVRAWRRGILSFVKLTYDRSHPRVLSLRGRELGRIGFFDEVVWLLAHRDVAQVAFRDDGLSFVDGEGLRHEVRWPAGAPHPVEDAVFDGDRLVERYTYRDVKPASTTEIAAVRD